MSAHNKVVWSEGLFLQPQHFQQQDRYFEGYVEARCQSLVPFSWGFTEIELERDLLSIGKFALRRAAGVFPDGTPFRIPEDDPLPPPLDVGAQVRDQILYLAVPVRQGDAPQVERTAAADGLARHDVRELEVRDATSTGSNAALLEVGALRTRFLIASEMTSAYACVPLAHIIERRADNQVLLDEKFIPTVLHARTAIRLTRFMTELVGLLHQRGEELGTLVVASGRGSVAEITDFLMLQALNRYEPLLTHLAESGAVHPEELFRLYVAMAGELATFTTSAKRPPALAEYRHERLRESFEPVEFALRKAFADVRERRAMSIPIETRKFGYSVANVVDKSLYGTAVFVFAVRADLPAEELRKRIPAQLKVGPVEKIRELVTRQISGVPVQPMPAAPRQISYHAGSVYFDLDQSNDLWGQMKNSGGIGLFLPDEFPGLALELWAIRN